MMPKAPKQKPDAKKRIEISRRPRVQTQIANALALLLTAALAGFLVYGVTFGFPPLPESRLLASLLPRTAGPSAPPVHNLHAIARVSAVIFAAALLSRLRFEAPLAKLLGTRWPAYAFRHFELGDLACSWPRTLRRFAGPALQQSSLRRATLVSGIVAILLWHLGPDALRPLWSAALPLLLASLFLPSLLFGYFPTPLTSIMRTVSTAALLYVATHAALWML